MDALSSFLSAFPTHQTTTAAPKLKYPTTLRSSSSPNYNDIDDAPKPPIITTPPLRKKLAVGIFHALDDWITNFIDLPLRPSIDPTHVLSHNFAPVNELPPTECELIQGSLPPCLHGGAYIRNGPNPQFFPRGPHHLFDGDGMLHCIKISRGGRAATLCSRYVKTYMHTIDREAGSHLFPSIFSSFSNGVVASAMRGALAVARVLAGQFNLANGFGFANTSLAFFGNRLYALGEPDLPYALRLTPDGDVHTIGRHNFDGKLFTSMTAHPKIDPDTGEAFAYRYNPISPFLTYFRFDANGNKQPDVPIFSFSYPPLLHDFAITKKYAIFVDIQIYLDPTKIIGRGSPVVFDPLKMSRIGVIPRYAKDGCEMRWIDVPDFNILHAINAWDEEDAIVMMAPNILSPQHVVERMDLVHASIEKVRIDLKTGMVTRKPISKMNLEVSVINQAYVGKKNKFVYASVSDPMPKFSGVVKLDVLKECTVASRMYGPNCYGSEVLFVAREEENPKAEEDDGYLVTYVHDEVAGESEFLVMDAKSPQLNIVAAVKLPRRVPYGFHGLFVKESDLKGT